MITLQSATILYCTSLDAPRRRGTLSANSQRLYRHYAMAAAAFFPPHTPLSKVKNGAVKEYVDSLRARKLSPVSINSHISILSAVIRSVKNADGEALFTQAIDKDFCALPIVKREEQECATAADIEKGIALPLVAFLAASGLRISEALALEIDGAGDSYQPETGTIHIRKTLKTPAAARVVILPETFRVWFNARIPATGRIFPLSYQTARARLQSAGLPNAHSFRRFRVTHLRTSRCAEDVTRSQLGHSSSNITDRYSYAASDLEFVRAEIERCGVGFDFTEKGR